MHKYVRKLTLGMVTLLLLSVAVSAASKVAIIKVSSGTATLDGQTISKAKMAADGQMLKVAEGSKVRIQLLGSKEELTITGPQSLKIDKGALKQRAKEVSRNSAQVAQDIGSRNTASASISRSSAKPPTLVDLQPTLPPQLEDNQLLIKFKFEELPLRSDHTIKVEVFPLDGDGLRLGHTFQKSDPLVTLEMPPDSIEEGKGYRFRLIYNIPKVQMYTYTQTFRLLTADQKAFLAEAEQELLSDYRSEQDILPLLRLASLFQEFDQNQKVLEYLQMAYNSEHLNNKEQWDSLRKSIEKWEDSLNMPVPIPQK